jgi:hypothetical protein
VNDDFLKISYQDLLRDPDLIDRVQRDARRYRARELRRMLGHARNAVSPSQETMKPRLRTARCG